MQLAKRRQAHRSSTGTCGNSSPASNKDDEELHLRHPHPYSVSGEEAYDKQLRHRTVNMVRRTGILVLIALLVIVALVSVNGQASDECMTRNLPVGVSIEETVEASSDTKTFVSLLAYFGGSIEEGMTSIPLAVADDKFACKLISPVSDTFMHLPCSSRLSLVCLGAVLILIRAVCHVMK